MLKRLGKASLRTQIVLLATLPLVIMMIAAPIFLKPVAADVSDQIEDWASFLSGKLVLTAQQVRMAGTPAEKSAILETAIKAGGLLQRPLSTNSVVIDLTGLKEDQMRQRLLQRLPAIARNASTSGELVTVRIDGDHALAFRLPASPGWPAFLKAIVFDMVRIAAIVFPMFLLAYFLAWRISFPLIHFAAAAKRISLEDEQKPFIAQGALEVVSLADSLNAMQARIRKMVEHRTHVLRSVSHDLRTPLTRLRMRAERCQEPELRRQMLVDITALTALIDDSMAYVSDSSATELLRRIDVVSLLQTIASDYQDMGLSVTFSGPRRLAHKCKPRGISRAVSNLIDNAARYAANIEVSVQADDNGVVIIEVSDDGPGLPEELKNKAIEPFFKADPARTVGQRSGFGLGLAIADGIAKNHGGSLRLLDKQPHGLVVRIELPADL
jgi:signal transduction histidine kinase